jgi:hypothetical protein
VCREHLQCSPVGFDTLSVHVDTVKPYLFIDVDGVLNTDRRYGTVRYTALGYNINLNPNDGPRLLELADRYELVWATTWKDLANVHIGPRIGLPELPWIEWSDPYPTQRTYPGNIMIKTMEVIKYADGRPFAWLDDDLTSYDIKELEKHTCLPILVSYKYGIIGEHLDMLREWNYS